MVRGMRFFAVVFLAVFLCACNRGAKQDIFSEAYAPPPVSSPIKVRVVDVSNDTHKVFDVDVIGLLWGGLENSLKKRGMLWAKQFGGEPYTIEAHILEYKKGSMPYRFVPFSGTTYLSVRCELRDATRHIATIEAKRKIAFGGGTFKRGAWKEVFEEVSEEIITEAARKL